MSLIDQLKGLHPGIYLERELKKRKIRKGRFALSLNEFPQTLVSITKGKRKMNTSLSLKIENSLGLEEGLLMTLQVFYDIAEEKKLTLKRSRNVSGQGDVPDLELLRSVLFWDTKIENIDWQKQKTAVIKRVFERGNEKEKQEIIRFYGKTTVDEILMSDGR